MAQLASSRGVPVEALPEIALLDAQAASQVAVIRAQTDQDIRYMREPAAIEHEYRLKGLQAKLEFAEKHHELRLRMEASKPKELRDGERQPG